MSLSKLQDEFRFAEKLHEKDGAFEIVSPFELRIGSTEYARQLGKEVSEAVPGSQSDDATSFATVRLARPYYGIETASLTFKGAERRLAQVALTRGTFFGAGEGLTLPDCRDIVTAIAADLCKRLGVKPEEVSGREKSDAAAAYSVELARKSSKSEGGDSASAIDFITREISVRVGDYVVRYRAVGSVGATDGMGNVILSVFAQPADR